MYIFYSMDLILKMILPIRETSKPTKLIITDILEYRRNVGNTFFSSILFDEILLDNPVILIVQKLLIKAITTPIYLIMLYALSCLISRKFQLSLIYFGIS